MKTTPEMLIESPSFMDFATVEACKIVAQSNGRQVKDAIMALKLGAPEVQQGHHQCALRVRIGD